MSSSQSRQWLPQFSKQDVKSGFLVFLIALPLSLGIAMASGFPPIAGVISAIVGGVLVSFLGSSRLTIKGPAAGLIVIALGAVQELGHGDPMLGYRRALAVGVMAAVLQILFSMVRGATLGMIMSPSVVHGMLAAIGVIIVSKQAHTVMGVSPEGKEPLELLAELPHSVMHANPEILVIGGVSLVVLFGLPLIRKAWVKAIPAPLVVLALTVPLGLIFDLQDSHHYNWSNHDFTVGPEYLVTLPGNLIKAVAFPDFSQVFTGTSIKYAVMFALVGIIESTLSVIAVDGMDPEKRPSDLNQDLRAVGIGNLVSAMVGGLPMISEIVRSKANIDADAKSPWSNFFHGLFLLSFVVLLPSLLQKIPLAALAAMLVYTGARLASPAEVRHSKEVGNDQLILFVTTMIVTLATDLLIGVAVGIALKFVLHLVRGAPLASLFRTRIQTSQDGNKFIIKLEGTAAFTNLIAVRKAVSDLPDEVTEVVVDFSEVKIIDHTFLTRLEAIANEWPNRTLQLDGLGLFHASSAHKHASRKRSAQS